MDSLEPKKLALLRILQILHKYSDCDHPLKQDDILRYLENDYNIALERKAVGRNVALLKDAGYDIESRKEGSYLASRDFDDSELRLLIDSVLASKHIEAKASKDLIDRLCGLSNVYFKRNIRNVFAADSFDKIESREMFYNISIIDEAIKTGKAVKFRYGKYGMDKVIHFPQNYLRVSPYQLILHNQRYYLMGGSMYPDSRYNKVSFYRLDRMTDIAFSGLSPIPIKSLPGYANGINYNDLATAMPYLYSGTPERISFYADKTIIDDIIYWLGKGVTFAGEDKNTKRVKVNARACPEAIFYWALQYAEHVEILEPASLRDRIRTALDKARERYK